MLVLIKVVGIVVIMARDDSPRAHLILKEPPHRVPPRTASHLHEPTARGSPRVDGDRVFILRELPINQLKCLDHLGLRPRSLLVVRHLSAGVSRGQLGRTFAASVGDCGPENTGLLGGLSAMNRGFLNIAASRACLRSSHHGVLSIGGSGEQLFQSKSGLIR